MSGNLTRINNNQITDAVSGNTQFGINANTKIQPHSITSTLLANNLTYGSDLTVAGNLSVTGNVTAIDTTNTTIEDPLLLLASTQTGSPTVDIGYIGQRGTSDNIAFVWDESLKAFVTVFTNSGAGDNTNINILSYADFITANANVTGNLIATNVSLTGNVVSPLNVTGNIAAGNIVAVGLISATGNVETGGYFMGDGSMISNINAGNVATYRIFNGTSSANIGTANGNMVVTINGNPNSVFYDGGVSVAGNVTTNAAVNAASLSLSGNVTSDLNVTNNATVGVDLSVVGNIYSTNIIPTANATYTLGTPTAQFAAAYLGAQTLYLGTTQFGANNSANVGTINNNIIVTYSNGNADITATGNISTGSGAVNAFNLSLGGNVVSDLNVTTAVNAANVNAGAVSSSGNVIAVDTVNSNQLSLSGNVISNLNVTTNLTANNVNTVTNVSAQGNVYGANFATTGPQGNITGANVVSATTFTATGNVYANNVFAQTYISAGGNVTTNQTFVGNALYGNSLVITSTYDGLLFSVTGNINAGNTYITNVVNPENPQDAATKSYVDGIANGLQVKASSNTATTGNIFATTGFTYTYNNGSSGVGATITFGTVGNVTIDNVQLTSGMRVLVKDEPLVAPTDGTTPSAAYNGIYDVTTAGSPSAALVLTRSTDDDTPAEMYSAYTFVNSGATSANHNSGWASTNTPTSPGDPIVIGTTYYIFVQFSQAGSYSGGNAIAVVGSVINALYDGNTIGVNGSNQLHIPANALLTTPNIGDATGNSLSVVGSLTGDIITVNTASVVGNALIGNVSTTNLSLTGNVLTDLNVSTDAKANNVYAVNIFSAGGNITGDIVAATNNGNGTNFKVGDDVWLGDINIADTMSIRGIENSANGYIIFGNADTTAQLGRSGSGPLTYNGSFSATGNVTAANFATSGSGGNITGANVVSATTFTATGNVYGQNFVTPNTTIDGGVLTTGLVSATGNIITANYLFGDGYYISNINPGNVASNKITNGGSYANATTTNGNIVIAVGASSDIVATFYDQGVNFAINVSAQGDVTAGGLISATGNVIGGNVLTGGDISATGTLTTSQLINPTSWSSYPSGGYQQLVGVGAASLVPGNVFVDFQGNFSATGNISSGSTFFVDTTTSSVTLGANVTETAGATLAINATDSILLPVGNVAQRPSTPATGMLRYNSTVSQCEIWNGAAWVAVGGSTYTVITNEQFNGDGSTVQFTLGSSQTTDSCIVTINGVVQIPTTAYSVSGIYPTCYLTFTEAPEIGDTIDVREITTTTSVTAISNSPGNAIVSVEETIGQVDITGNLVAQLNASAPSLTANSSMSFQLLSNTSLKILVRGTDGVTRSATLTLS